MCAPQPYQVVPSGVVLLGWSGVGEGEEAEGGWEGLTAGAAGGGLAHCFVCCLEVGLWVWLVVRLPRLDVLTEV